MYLGAYIVEPFISNIVYFVWYMGQNGSVLISNPCNNQ